MNRLHFALGLAAVAIAAPVPATSQGPSTVVRMVATAGLRQGASTMIRLRAQGEPANLLLIDTTKATPREIAAALQSVGALRARVGGNMKYDVEAFPKTAPRGKGLNAKQSARIQHQLNTLRHSQLIDVPGMGRAHAMDVVVPLKTARKAGK